ncbi:hypothetical protein RUND412_003415 [Rhizina undulata]
MRIKLEDLNYRTMFAAFGINLEDPETTVKNIIARLRAIYFSGDNWQLAMERLDTIFRIIENNPRHRHHVKVKRIRKEMLHRFYNNGKPKKILKSDPRCEFDQNFDKSDQAPTLLHQSFTVERRPVILPAFPELPPVRVMPHGWSSLYNGATFMPFNGVIINNLYYLCPLSKYEKKIQEADDYMDDLRTYLTDGEFSKLLPADAQIKQRLDNPLETFLLMSEKCPLLDAPTPKIDFKPHYKQIFIVDGRRNEEMRLLSETDYVYRALAMIRRVLCRPENARAYAMAFRAYMWRYQPENDNNIVDEVGPTRMEIEHIIRLLAEHFPPVEILVNDDADGDDVDMMDTDMETDSKPKQKYVVSEYGFSGCYERWSGRLKLNGKLFDAIENCARDGTIMGHYFLMLLHTVAHELAHFIATMIHTPNKTSVIDVREREYLTPRGIRWSVRPHDCDEDPRPRFYDVRRARNGEFGEFVEWIMFNAFITTTMDANPKNKFDVESWGHKFNSENEHLKLTPQGAQQLFFVYMNATRIPRIKLKEIPYFNLRTGVVEEKVPTIVQPKFNSGITIVSELPQQGQTSPMQAEPVPDGLFRGSPDRMEEDMGNVIEPEDLDREEKTPNAPFFSTSPGVIWPKLHPGEVAVPGQNISNPIVIKDDPPSNVKAGFIPLARWTGGFPGGWRASKPAANPSSGGDGRSLRPLGGDGGISRRTSNPQRTAGYLSAADAEPVSARPPKPVVKDIKYPKPSTEDYWSKLLASNEYDSPAESFVDAMEYYQRSDDFPEAITPWTVLPSFIAATVPVIIAWNFWSWSTMTGLLAWTIAWTLETQWDAWRRARREIWRFWKWDRSGWLLALVSGICWLVSWAYS